MVSSLFVRFNLALSRFNQYLAFTLGRNHPPDAFCLAVVGASHQLPQQFEGAKFSIKDILGDGFLWAVPKHRTTIEKRMKKKFGNPKYIMKILSPRKDLKMCNVCGDDHEAGVLCPTCYKKVIEETKAMQEAIQKELKLEPVEQEVAVLYDGEKDDKPSEFYKNKRIIEMKKPRPAWFSKNLLQQTTQKGATTSDIKPSDLG